MALKEFPDSRKYLPRVQYTKTDATMVSNQHPNLPRWPRDMGFVSMMHAKPRGP